MIKRFGKFRIMIFLVFLFVFGILSFFAIRDINDPKNLYLNGLEKLSDDFFRFMEENQSSLSNFILNNNKLSLDTAIRMNYVEGDSEKSVNINSSYVEDKRHELSYLNMNTVDDDSIFRVQSFLKNNRLYYRDFEQEGSYLFQDFDYFSIFNLVNIPSLDSVSILFINNIQSMIKKSDIRDKKQVIKVDGDVHNTRQLSLELTKGDFIQLLEDTLIDIKNDKTIQNLLLKTLGIDFEDLERYLDYLHGKNLSSDEVLFTFNIYIEHINQPVLYEIIVEDHQFRYYTYRNVSEFVLNSGSETVFDLIAIHRLNKTEVRGSIYEVFDLEGEYFKSGGNTSIHLKLLLPNYKEEEQYIRIDYEGDIVEVSKNSDYKVTSNIDFDISMGRLASISQKGTIEIVSHVLSDTAVIIPDVLSEEEVNLSSLEQVSKFREYIKNLPLFNLTEIRDKVRR